MSILYGNGWSVENIEYNDAAKVCGVCVKYEVLFIGLERMR